jgi:hypothetical protein
MSDHDYYGGGDSENRGAKLPLPESLRYDDRGGYLYGDNDHLAADTHHHDEEGRIRMRGWGHLTGRGAGGLGLSDKEAAAYQDRLGAEMALRWNAHGAPIPMVLHCPRCQAQHVDVAKPDACETCGLGEADCPCPTFAPWLNPPHNSHRCANCNTVWRPADVPTNGVAQAQTRGDRDTWPEVS